MNIRKIENKRINEVMYIYEHKSGLKAFVIPKKGYSKKHATFATHYGSINREFVVPGESKTTRVPDGIAHFLEHKLFEQKDGNVMEKYSELGANPNAYTGFSQTVYLFTCTDKFNENFKLLLNFVQNPYITEESVEKEKGIIGQEIRMYQDDPGWRVMFNLLGAFYKEDPVRVDIAGSIESISKINKDTLYLCYNTFYHPSNMIILVVGDVEPENVFRQVEENIGEYEAKPEIERIRPEEPTKINKSFVEQSLAVSMPMFQMGFREIVPMTKGRECLIREISIKILLELLAGRSSELYNALYNEGLINSSFGIDYMNEETYAFSMLGGESRDPLAVRDRLLAEIDRVNKEGLNKKGFERILKSMLGRTIKQYNSIETISHNFISVYFKDVYLFDYFDAYDKITFENIEGLFREHFNSDNLALSVIKPV